MSTMTKRILPALVATVARGAPAAAPARKSPLDGQPDVRHKYELRLKRFEISPTFEATMNADYKHTLGFGAKLEYHLSDSLSIGGMIFFGTGLDTALTKAVGGSLPDTEIPGDPTPTEEQFTSHLNTMPLHGGVGATFTPWFGKLNLFSKVYLAFDIYVSGGFGFAQLKSELSDDACEPTSDGVDPLSGMDTFTDPRNDDPCNSGFKPGIQLGAGMHIFVNKFVALDISFRDYFFTDNPSGQDFDANRKVDSEDPRFLGHLFVGIGVSFYLPAKVKVSK